MRVKNKKQIINKVNKPGSIKKIKIIEKYCCHIKEGYSKYSFVECSHTEIEEIANELDEMNANNNFSYKKMIEAAYREGMKKWEGIGINGCQVNKNEFRQGVWFFFMKNIYGWSDKPVVKKEAEEKKIKLKLSMDGKEEF